MQTRSSKDEYSTGNQTIILGLEIFLDHRSLSSIDQKKLMTLSPSPDLPTPFFDLSRSLEVVWMSSEFYSSSFVLSSVCLSVFCLSVSISMLHLSKVPIDGAHVTDISCIS